MNNDIKTTILGVIKAGLLFGIALFMYLTGQQLPPELIDKVGSSTDWVSLLIAIYAVGTAVVGYFTNKSDKDKEK